MRTTLIVNTKNTTSLTPVLGLKVLAASMDQGTRAGVKYWEGGNAVQNAFYSHSILAVFGGLP